MDPAQHIPHVYQPFSRATEIRVAIIQPAMDHAAPLHFEFYNASLKELEGRYEAISYVWGAPILEYPVYHTSDGSRLFITENLDRALRRLRHRLDPRWLWADAMCIDQGNNAEKAVQIPLMVDIFRGAKRVLAWLHHGDEAIERGMQCIERISRHREEFDTLRGTGDEEDDDDEDDNGDRSAFGVSSIDPSSVLHQAVEQGDMSGIRSSGGRAIESELCLSELGDLMRFLDLPYFRRLWMWVYILLCTKSSLIASRIGQHPRDCSQRRNRSYLRQS
jgi:hypothetical protein